MNTALLLLLLRRRNCKSSGYRSWMSTVVMSPCHSECRPVYVCVRVWVWVCARARYWRNVTIS